MIKICKYCLKQHGYIILYISFSRIKIATFLILTPTPKNQLTWRNTWSVKNTGALSYYNLIYNNHIFKCETFIKFWHFPKSLLTICGKRINFINIIVTAPIANWRKVELEFSLPNGFTTPTGSSLCTPLVQNRVKVS